MFYTTEYVELWPCKGQRARAQGSVLYYHIVLYTLPDGIVEGELLEEMIVRNMDFSRFSNL